MTIYNTGNPTPSVDARDLNDNMIRMEEFALSELNYGPDRFGVNRLTMQGIRNASQYVDLGPYAAGLVFTSRNQVFSYSGEFYAPGPSVVLPYTTTGAGAGEIANFRNVGDAILRSDLADDSDPAKGSALVQFFRAVTGFVSRTVSAKVFDIVSIKDFGAVGDGVTVDTAAINAALAYVNSVGCKLLIPAGRYLTAGGHSVTATGKILSMMGDGPDASVFLCSGSGDCLTISSASQTCLSGFGFDKVVRDKTGQGLVVKNTAYAKFDHITAFGFLNGIKTEAVLTSLLVKPLCRFNDIGMYLAEGPASNPNAITIINPSLSLNGRWGLRADKPASLLVIGGSIEGNGWDETSFHGGAYISNAGQEGGVGATFDGVHMEQNRGEADIHIAQTAYPNTVFNIHNCPVFPIDDTNVTANRVYLENSVAITLNISGNNFKHFGGYTPNAARKYIKSEAPTLVSVNTNGDSAQFYSAVETPALEAWGPSAVRGAMHSARVSVNNSGTASIAGNAYNVASVSRVSTGLVLVTFVRPMSSTDYQAIPVPLLAAKLAIPTLKTVNDVTIDVRDLGGNLSDSPFDLVISGGV